MNKSILLHADVSKIAELVLLTLSVLILIPFIPADQGIYLCKRCRSRWDGKPSHQDLHCLAFYYWFLSKQFATMDVSKFRDGWAHLRNSEVEGLSKYGVGVLLVRCFLTGWATAKCERGLGSWRTNATAVQGRTSTSASWHGWGKSWNDVPFYSQDNWIYEVHCPCSLHNNFREWMYFQKRQLSKSVLLPSWKVVYSKRKEVAPFGKGANSFLLE